jgi:hypothetical protein
METFNPVRDAQPLSQVLTDIFTLGSRDLFGAGSTLVPFFHSRLHVVRRGAKREIDMLQTVKNLSQDNATLRLALELLGFDCNTVIEHLHGDSERIWKEIPLRMASVRFDSQKAVVFGLSEHAQRSAEAMFTSMRR